MKKAKWCIVNTNMLVVYQGVTDKDVEFDVDLSEDNRWGRCIFEDLNDWNDDVENFYDEYIKNSPTNKMSGVTYYYNGNSIRAESESESKI